MSEVLLYGVPVDPHLITLKNELQKRNRTTTILNSNTIEANHFISGSFHANTNKWKISDAKNDSIFNDSKLIWLRNKDRVTHILREEDQSKYYLLKEREAALTGFANINTIKQINSNFNIQKSENKAIQINAAQKTGFKVPSTIISNDLNEIINFSSNHPHLIQKPLSVPAVHSHNPDLDPIMMYTSNITIEDLKSSQPESYSLAPVIIQEAIRKSSELRVIQIGEFSKAFQLVVSDDSGEPDWRIFHRVTPYQETQLETEIQKLCEKYLKEMNLDMGVFDIAVNEHGEYFFLECNPSGQWAWLDEAHEDNPTAQFIADCFIKLYL